MLQQTSLDQFLFVDIETVSEQPVFSDLEPHWQQLWEEKVRYSIPDGLLPGDYYEQRAGVMAEFAKVICVSLAYFRKQDTDYELRVKSVYGDDEASLLKALLDILQPLMSGQIRRSFTGHNIREFDIPFLCRRLLINGIPIPSFLDFQNMKPWETNLVDTFQLWRFGDFKNYTSLKLLAAALQVPSPKDDIDGSQVGEVYWKEKNLSRIVRYCEKDVITVANIILRFKGLPLLLEEQVVVV